MSVGEGEYYARALKRAVEAFFGSWAELTLDSPGAASLAGAPAAQADEIRLYGFGPALSDNDPGQLRERVWKGLRLHGKATSPEAAVRCALDIAAEDLKRMKGNEGAWRMVPTLERFSDFDSGAEGWIAQGRVVYTPMWEVAPSAGILARDMVWA